MRPPDPAARLGRPIPVPARVAYVTETAMAMAMAFATATAAATAVGCGSHAPRDGTGAGGAGGDAGAVVAAADASDDADDESAAPGDCPAAARAPDGTCAGVPPDACGAGFAPDGARGCTPVLPAAPCPPGQLALPGETACHDVGACGTGTWGDIPVEADTTYVDRAYTGGASDGTRDHPWTTITDGIAHAASGAIVAIAAGAYDDALSLVDKPLRLWGVCPSRVGLRYVVDIAVADAEVHGIGVSGGFGAIAVRFPRVTVANVWVHDVDSTAIAVYGLADATVVRDVLVERAGLVAVAIDTGGADATRLVVRGTADLDHNGAAAGIAIGTHGTAAHLSLHDAVLEGNAAAGILATGDAVVDGDALVVRRNGGGGVVAGCGAVVSIVASVFDGNGVAGVAAVNASITLDAVVVGRTAADAPTGGGLEISALDGCAARARGAASIRRSVVRGVDALGIGVTASDATLDGVFIDHPRPDASGLAIGIASSAASGSDAAVTVRGSVVAGTTYAGIVGDRGTIDVAATRIDGVAALPDGSFGDGIAFDGTTGSVSGSIVRGAARVGLSAFSAHVTLRTTTFEDDAIDLDVEQDGSLGAGATTAMLDDGGGNVCHRPAGDVACVAQSSGLAPPSPPAP